MIIKVSPTGCNHNRGMVHVTIWAILEPGDARYEEHHVYAPIDEEDYLRWAEPFGDDLPIVEGDPWHGYPGERYWRDNPFVMFGLYVHPDTPDDEIMARAEIREKEIYEDWRQEKELQGRAPDMRDWPCVEAKLGMKEEEINREIDKLRAKGYDDFVIRPHTQAIGWIVPSQRLTEVEAKVAHLQETPLERRPSLVEKVKR